ncbi:MAG: hypothetical protein QXT66_02985, partial [Nitrososphaerota archaeon]
MPGFISPKAKIRGSIGGNVFIFGPSEISEDTFLDCNTVVGYPTRGRLAPLLGSTDNSTEILEGASLGSYIGPRCIVRSFCIIYEEAMLEASVELGHGVLIRSGSVV